MEITISQLRRIIKEEVSRVLREVDVDEDPPWMEDQGPQGAPPCDYCGSENTEPHDPIPSMAGYGEDVSWTCLDCGETSFAGPEM